MVERTRILYVAPRYPNAASSAAEVRSNQLVKRLAEHVDLRVVGFQARPSDGVVDGVQQLALNTSVQMAAAQVFRPLQPRALARFNSRSARQSLRQIADGFKPDVVHLDTFGVAAHSETLGDYPLLLHVHDAISPKYHDWATTSSSRLRRLDRFLQGRLARRVEQRTFSQAQRVVIDSPDDLVHFPPEVSTCVIPLGFDESVYSPRGTLVEHRAPAIVFSGSMDSLQSIDGAHQLIRRIMPLVWDRRPDVQLHLVGSNPPAELRVIADADPRIVLTGFVEDLAAYLRSASVYICPLSIGSGMRTRLVEALAVGCPSVASENACRGLERPAGGTPWREADTPEEFAAITLALLDDQRSADELGQRAARYALERYSWSAMIDRLMVEYQAIVAAS